MDETRAWQTIAEERRAFADVLDTLTPEQWATPSLCGEWTVRDVAAHIMVGPTASIPEVAKAMFRARFKFDRANVLLAKPRAARPTAEITAVLRDRATSRFTPPGHDWHAPLTDLFIHRLDCLHPLGIPTDRPLDPWPEMLGLLTSPKGRGSFVPKGAPELTLVATDVEWSHGTGPRVEGPAEALALALTRRPVRLDELQGPGTEMLRSWARG